METVYIDYLTGCEDDPDDPEDPDNQAIDNQSVSRQSSYSKIIMDGRLYILYGEQIYDAQGQRMK